MAQATHITTETLAEAMTVKPDTIRARLCRFGSYFGVVPIKCPNGRLLWPADAKERILAARHPQTASNEAN